MKPSLPIAVALLGAGYYVFTRSQKPPADVPMTADDFHALSRWHEHMSGARFALAFSLAGAGLLFWSSRSARSRSPRFERFERTSLS
jgi:hypothetical protein